MGRRSGPQEILREPGEPLRRNPDLRADALGAIAAVLNRDLVLEEASCDAGLIAKVLAGAARR